MSMRTEDKLTGICILGFSLFLLLLMLLAASKQNRRRCVVCDRVIDKREGYIYMQHLSRTRPRQTLLMCHSYFANLRKISEHVQKDED